MLKYLWELLTSVATLARDLQKYNAEMKEIRKELRDITIIVHALAQDIKNSKEHAELKQKNLLLQIDNRVQLLESGMPPPIVEKKRITKKAGKTV